MDATTKNFLALQAQLRGIENQLRDMRAAIAGTHSAHRIGDRVQMKISASGTPVWAEVVAIDAGIDAPGCILMCYRGKKVNKDGSLANIACYLYENVAEKASA